MPHAQTRLLPSLLLPLIALPGTALADLTATGLWADWQTAARGQGMSVTAQTTTQTEDGLRLTGVETRLTQADGAAITAVVPLVTLTELGDGRVELAIPEGKQVTITPAGDDSSSALLAVDTSGLTVTASGTPEETDYVWSAPALSVTLEEFEPGEAPLEADLTLTATDLSGRLTGYDAELDGPVTAVFEAAETAWAVSFSDPVSGAAMSTEATQQDVVIQAESIGMTPDGTPGDDTQLRMAFDSGSGTSRSSQSIGGTTQLTETSHESASLRADLTAEQGFYTGAGAGIAVTIDDPNMPVRPITLTLDEVDMAFVGPVSDADTPQPFDVTLEVIGLAPTEALWAQLDPAGMLPREPMTLTADLEGQALVGPAARIPGMPEAASSDFAPTEVTVNGINLTYGEARAEATGAFSFPTPSDAAIPLSQPQPVGTLDVTLTGVLDLLTQLGQSGLVPQQQLMAAQMMIGMFAAPQPDGTMTSRIESREDGSLFINGNRIR